MSKKAVSKFDTQLRVKSVVYANTFLYYESSGFLLLNDTIFLQ